MQKAAYDEAVETEPINVDEDAKLVHVWISLCQN